MLFNTPPTHTHTGPVFGGGPPGPYPPYHQDLRFPGPWDYSAPPQQLPPGTGPPPPQDGRPLAAQGPQDLPGGPQPSGGQGQDCISQQAAAQDPVRSAMSEP